MKNRKILSLLALLSISFAVYANNDRGIEFYRAGMFEASKNFFLQQKSDNPDEQAVAAYYLGLLYANEQNIAAAAAEFQKAVDIAPKSPYGYIGKGRLELKNNVKEAEKLFKQAESLGKKNADVQVQIADAYFANNMIAKATSTLEKAKKVNSSFPDIYLLEGEMALKQTINSETINEAVTKFNDAFYFSKDQNKTALLKLARMYRLQNRQDLALNKLNEAIALDKDYLPAYIMIGDIKLSQAKNNEAIAAYEKVIAACEPPIEVFENYAQALYFDKQYKKSLEEIQKILLQKNDNALLHRLEAYNHYELGNHVEGLIKMEKFLSSIPKEKQIYLDFITLGRFYTKQKNYEKAMESFNKAIAIDSEKPEIYKEMALAQSSFELQNYEDAIKNFDKYFELELKEKIVLSDLDSYAKICRKGAGEIIGAYEIYIKEKAEKKKTTQTPEEIAAQKVLFDKYIERGVQAYTDILELDMEVSPVWLKIGYAGRADLYTLVDVYGRVDAPDKIIGAAKPYHEEAIEFMLNNNTDGRFNRDIVNSYTYLAQYYMINKNTKTALEFLDKVLAIDPVNETAIYYSKELKRKK